MGSGPGQQPSIPPSGCNSSPPQSYLIIGAGCFGAATALQLARSDPSLASNITLLDRTPPPCPSAAAHDLNKIIRAEYADPFYMRLALEAMDLWKSDPIFSPYFHPVGMLLPTTLEHASKIAENYTSITSQLAPVELIEPATAKERFGGIFRSACLDKVETCLFSPEAGWGDAENALQNIIKSAIALGVKYVPHAVDKLLFDETGHFCLGARTVTGIDLHAQNVILCTGANTAWLIANSAPDKPALQVGDRMVAAAAIMGAYRVPTEQMGKFEFAPIVVNPVGVTPGESIPPGKTRLLKCTHELSFTNMLYHNDSHRRISAPPEDPTSSTWTLDVPAQLKNEVKYVKDMLYGEHIGGLVPEFHRMCWDAVTPNQDFIICAHPHSQNLYIASGGSFHAWKFMPSIGGYVEKMIKGNLDPDMAKRWAWDRANSGGACAVYLPTRDLGGVV
ncbi:L-pipecolate oxidase [Trichophyton interdigitale]|uniref:L-pipecolate oxidase n=1 Tax=Trichophyton interdigitale TaxID=101480 RepID=A0A9P4YK07_9EURO|nr:L-pipecolate oxidase [Trichophyton interdigitale]KAF3900427.1 L-pipecolate oxidase [Trichophyton interdigitale]KAG8211234.1 L-pipecolate oxidase [Trichophyton interdigitale]